MVPAGGSILSVTGFFHPVADNLEILFRIAPTLHSRALDIFLFVAADGDISLPLYEIVQAPQGGRFIA